MILVLDPFEGIIKVRVEVVEVFNIHNTSCLSLF
jgi:hypothetical protein